MACNDERDLQEGHRRDHHQACRLAQADTRGMGGHERHHGAGGQEGEWPQLGEVKINGDLHSTEPEG
jgi:hypothetical protein